MNWLRRIFRRRPIEIRLHGVPQLSIMDSRIFYSNPVTAPHFDMEIIVPAGGTEAKRLAVLCHEMGHAVAAMLKFPGAMRDQRLLGLEPKETTTEMVIAEEEAWDVAAQIFKEVRREALASYYLTHGREIQ